MPFSVVNLILSSCWTLRSALKNVSRCPAIATFPAARAVAFRECALRRAAVSVRQCLPESWLQDRSWQFRFFPTTPWNWDDRKIPNSPGTRGNQPHAAQLLLKPAGLIGLVEFRVEQNKAAITQRENTCDK